MSSETSLHYKSFEIDDNYFLSIRIYFSIYEIEVYAHENDLNVLMAEGDFGDRRMNHLLLGESLQKFRQNR